MIYQQMVGACMILYVMRGSGTPWKQYAMEAMCVQYCTVLYTVHVQAGLDDCLFFVYFY